MLPLLTQARLHPERLDSLAPKPRPSSRLVKSLEAVIYSGASKRLAISKRLRSHWCERRTTNSRLNSGQFDLESKAHKIGGARYPEFGLHGAEGVSDGLVTKT